MKIFSMYYKKEFEVDTVIPDSGDAAAIIPHDAFENIVLNCVPAEDEVRYDFDAMTITDTHSVIRCTITNNRGRRVSAVGESTLDSLDTDISRKYPTTMAANRAFDKAAIAFMGFDSKVISSDGTSIGTTEVDVTNVNVEPPKEKPTEKPVEKKAAPAKDAAKAAEEKPATAKNTAAKSAEKKGKEEAALEKFGKVPFTIGTYATKGLTVADVYKEDPTKIAYGADKFKPKDEAGQTLVEACKGYIAAMEQK